MIQEIKPQSGIAFTLKKEQLLKVMDPEGKQVSDLFCVSQKNPEEWLSSGRSIDYADTLFLTKGHILYSNRSTPMLQIIKDTCGRHDFLMTPCSLKMFHLVNKNEDYHASCDENLCLNLEKFGIPPDRISTTFNIFMKVKVEESGRIIIETPVSKPGDFIIFKALSDLIVGLTACSHEETNGGRCKPICYEIMDHDA